MGHQLPPKRERANAEDIARFKGRLAKADITKEGKLSRIVGYRTAIKPPPKADVQSGIAPPSPPVPIFKSCPLTDDEAKMLLAILLQAGPSDKTPNAPVSEGLLYLHLEVESGDVSMTVGFHADDLVEFVAFDRKRGQFEGGQMRHLSLRCEGITQFARAVIDGELKQ